MSAHLERKGSKGRESLWESIEELEFGDYASDFNRSEGAAVDTQVCAISTSPDESLF